MFGYCSVVERTSAQQSTARIRKDMRAALLHSKKIIDVQLKSNREDLFKGAMDNRNVEEKAT